MSSRLKNVMAPGDFFLEGLNLVANCLVHDIILSFRYFRHAADSIFILTKNLAKYIHINRSALMP